VLRADIVIKRGKINRALNNMGAAVAKQPEQTNTQCPTASEDDFTSLLIIYCLSSLSSYRLSLLKITPEDFPAVAAAFSSSGWGAGQFSRAVRCLYKHEHNKRAAEYGLFSVEDRPVMPIEIKSWKKDRLGRYRSTSVFLEPISAARAILSNACRASRKA
jgi:hypothetical protein